MAENATAFIKRHWRILSIAVLAVAIAFFEPPVFVTIIITFAMIALCIDKISIKWGDDE